MKLPPFFSNPLVGLIGTVCSVISIPLAFLLYWDAIKERDLTYYVYPIRTAVLQSGYSTGLRVLYNNDEVKTDVTALQLAIWNRGREPISKDDILNQIRIITRPFVKILEVSVQKQSRSVIEFTADSSRLREGTVPLSWKLLEHSDGAIIQVLYAGPPQVDVSLEGVVLGQKKITRLGSEEQTRMERSGLSKTFFLVFGIISMLGFVLNGSMLFVVSAWSRSNKTETGGRRIIELVTAAIFLLSSLFLLYSGMRSFNIWLNIPEPPFGFFDHIALQEPLQLQEQLDKTLIPDRKRNPK